MSGVELKFYYHSLEGSSFLRPSVYLGTKTTGEDGTYKFKFNGEEYLEQGFFSIDIKKSGYFAHPTTAENFQTYRTIQTKDIQYNTPIVRNISLYKKATLELKIKSQNALDFENSMCIMARLNGLTEETSTVKRGILRGLILFLMTA